MDVRILIHDEPDQLAAHLSACTYHDEADQIVDNAEYYYGLFSEYYTRVNDAP